jgi:hypothetical protein
VSSSESDHKKESQLARHPQWLKSYPMLTIRFYFVLCLYSNLRCALNYVKALFTRKSVSEYDGIVRAARPFSSPWVNTVSPPSGFMVLPSDFLLRRKHVSGASKRYGAWLVRQVFRIYTGLFISPWYMSRNSQQINCATGRDNSTPIERETFPSIL